MIKKIISLPILIVLIFVGNTYAQTQHSFIAGNTFKSIANHVLEDLAEPFDPTDVKNGDIIFLKTDYVPYFFEYVHPFITSKYILLTHNADVSPIYLTAANIPWEGHDFSAYLDDPKLIVWFAHNIDFVHPKLKPLPLGIANKCLKKHKNKTLKRKHANPYLLKDKKPLLYINYLIKSNLQERKKAYEWCMQLPISYVIRKRKSFAAYLEDIRQYRFILSPFGNSKDCYRAWEALLMGSIPVMKHSLLDPLFDGLPVIFVGDWSEITQEFLENKYQEIVSGSYQYERMYADYWIEMIKSYQSNTCGNTSA